MFDTEKFITEVEKRPAIYDFKSKEYSNREYKQKAWDEIGHEMYKGWNARSFHEKNTLVKELQIKWKSIRDHFMRQLKQNINGEAPKKKKYVYFDQLLFLTKNLDARRYLPNYSSDTEKSEAPAKKYRSWKTIYPKYDPLERQDGLCFDYFPSDIFGYQRDELEGDRMGNRMFLLSLLPIMERLPDPVNLKLRLQLMEVCQEALNIAEEGESTTIGYTDEFYNSSSRTSVDDESHPGNANTEVEPSQQNQIREPQTKFRH